VVRPAPGPGWFDPRHNRPVNVRWVDPGARIGAERGEVVVCIPVYGAHELFAECLQSVLAHTPATAPILICDDASPDERSRDFVAGLAAEASSDHVLFYARRERNVGFPANANGGLAAATPADVVILNSDCVVAAGWLEGLRDAAYSGSAIATATALTNHGSVVSVPEAGGAANFAQAAAAVRAHSLRLRPHLITAVGHCVYMRRDALDLVGDFDLAFSPGYGEEVDFSQRCLRAGLAHVAADDVLVLHHGGASLGASGEANAVQHEHELMIAARYPYYHGAVHAVQADRAAPLARSVATARRAIKGLSVALDVRGSELDADRERAALELVAALAGIGEARLRLIATPRAAGCWVEEPEGVEVVSLPPGVVANPGDRVDVIHRVQPITRPTDLGGLLRLGDRLIVSYDDMTPYRNPSRFGSFRAWDRYRAVTRRALASADHVVFSSARSRDDAVADQLVEPARTSVVYPGLDHSPRIHRPVPAPPSGAVSLSPDAPVILCPGSDNVGFALRVYEELQDAHQWPGRLVLADTRADDQTQPSGVIALTGLGDAEREWLLERADVVLNPTPHPTAATGLVFEAAEREVPCLWAPGSALSELLPDAAAGVVPWDAAATATRALELMRDAGARRAHLDVVRMAAGELRWEAAARRLIDLYQRTCESVPVPAGAPERGERLMQEHLSEDAIQLVGPGGLLSPDVERPLLALATHRQIGDPVFGAIKAGYRMSNRLRRLAGRVADANGTRGSGE
jgi:GT2 family glycosyltransferase